MLEIAVGIFAAAGLLFLLWVILGWLLLPVRCHGVTVWFVDGDGRELERQVRGYRWLRDSGLFDGCLLLCDCGLSERGFVLAQLLEDAYDGIHFCTQETLWNELELGAEHDRTRRDNDSWHGAGRRVSECGKRI